MKKFSFSKKNRLKSNEQFNAVLGRRQRFVNELLTLYMADNDCCCRRFGVSIGKTLGKAVVRNRLKRLLREAFRQNQGEIPDGYDYLLMISPRWSKKIKDKQDSGKLAMQLTLQEVNDSFMALIAIAEKKIR